MTSVPMRSRRLSAADWDAWAATVPSTAVSPTESTRFRRFRQVVAPHPGMTAVDLACGTGGWTRQLASWGITVTGYDFSDEALRQAEAATPRASLSYTLWDIVADPIPSHPAPGRFDVVTCRHSLPFLEPGRLLTDVGRRLHGTDAADVASLDLGLEEGALSTIGAGWTRHEVQSLGRGDFTIVLSGYDRPRLPPSPTAGSRALSEIRPIRAPGDAAHTQPAARAALSGNGRAHGPSDLQPVEAQVCTAQE